MMAADKKRQKEEREFVHKFRPFAKLQTAEDYEEFVNGMLCMSIKNQTSKNRHTSHTLTIGN